MANPTLLGLRDYDEHDTIPFFAWSGSIPAYKGTFVKIIGSGFQNTATDWESLGSIGASYSNTVSLRYGVPHKVTAAGSGDNAIGMLLWDVKETDEHGNLLKFDPKKAAQMQVALSGQTVPIVTRGYFLYSGIDNPVTGGNTAYVSGAGWLTNASTAAFAAGATVGTFLGSKDSKGHVLVKINCQ